MRLIIRAEEPNQQIAMYFFKPLEDHITAE
jgi:hypothetical protein